MPLLYLGSAPPSESPSDAEDGDDADWDLLMRHPIGGGKSALPRAPAVGAIKSGALDGRPPMTLADHTPPPNEPRDQDRNHNNAPILVEVRCPVTSAEAPGDGPVEGGHEAHVAPLEQG